MLMLAAVWSVYKVGVAVSARVQSLVAPPATLTTDTDVSGQSAFNEIVNWVAME